MVVYWRCAGCPRAIINHDKLVAGLATGVAGLAEVVSSGPDANGTAADVYGLATVLIGPHGAGLSHMLLMRAPALVVEFQESHIALPFARMAAHLGFDHTILFPAEATHEMPMVVSVPEAVHVVVEWLKAHQGEL